MIIAEPNSCNVTDIGESRLGQYAVVWRDGGPVMIGEDAPKVSENPVNRPIK
jgi:hypothetical protein